MLPGKSRQGLFHAGFQVHGTFQHFGVVKEESSPGFASSDMNSSNDVENVVS